jgi:hypothetical protein
LFSSVHESYILQLGRELCYDKGNVDGKHYVMVPLCCRALKAVGSSFHHST